MDDGTANERVARVEGLLEQVETLPDPAAREAATEMAQALLDLYGEGLTRIVDEIAARDDGSLAEALGDDELVSHLLLLHGLHPVPVEERVRGALLDVRPYLESHGGDVELLGVEEGVAHLRLNGSCSGCPSSAMTLKLAIEEAIFKAAPDVEEVRAEGAVEEIAPPTAPPGGLIQLEVLQPAAPSGPAPAQPFGPWAMAGGMPELSGGGPVVKVVAGERLLFARLGETVYAYRPTCPGCEQELDDASLRAAELTCACGQRFDLLRAGRCLDQPQLHLAPVPLLEDESGLVKVALGAAA